MSVIRLDFWEHPKTKLLVLLNDNNPSCLWWPARLWTECEKSKSEEVPLSDEDIDALCLYWHRNGSPEESRPSWMLKEAKIVERIDEKRCRIRNWSKRNAQLVSSWKNGKRNKGNTPQKQPEGDPAEPEANPRQPEGDPAEPKSNPPRAETETETETGTGERERESQSERREGRARTREGRFITLLDRFFSPGAADPRQTMAYKALIQRHGVPTEEELTAFEGYYAPKNSPDSDNLPWRPVRESLPRLFDNWEGDVVRWVKFLAETPSSEPSSAGPGGRSMHWKNRK